MSQSVGKAVRSMAGCSRFGGMSVSTTLNYMHVYNVRWLEIFDRPAIIIFGSILPKWRGLSEIIFKTEVMGQTARYIEPR